MLDPDIMGELVKGPADRGAQALGPVAAEVRAALCDNRRKS